LHVVTATVNIPGSSQPTYRKRRTERFEMSPYAIGGPATGWVPADRYDDAVWLAQALAISAATVSPEGGRLVPSWARGILALLNVDLSYWFRNPRMAGKTAEHRDPRFRRWGHFWSRYVAKELMGQNSEEDALILTSDGGHHDNLGLTTLVDRDVKLCVCIDASADPDFKFADLAWTTSLLRVDGDWALELDIAGARPAPREEDDAGDKARAVRFVKSPVVHGTLKRPDGREIEVIYVKAGVPADAPFEVLRYAEEHPTFPHQSTANQFFDERQFEAYRLLGEHLALKVAEILASAPMRSVLAPLVRRD
jgi:hypothetical protein